MNPVKDVYEIIMYHEESILYYSDGSWLFGSCPLFGSVQPNDQSLGYGFAQFTPSSEPYIATRTLNDCNSQGLKFFV